MFGALTLPQVWGEVTSWGPNFDPFARRFEGEDLSGVPCISPTPFIPVGQSVLARIELGQCDTSDPTSKFQRTSFFGVAAEDPLSGAIDPQPKTPPDYSLWSPASSPERVSYFDVSRCIEIEESASGVWEIVRTQSRFMGALCIDGIVADLRVDALTEDGFIAQTILLDGQGIGWGDSAVVHPDAGVGDLTWQWFISTDRGKSINPVSLVQYIAGAGDGAIGANVLFEWKDSRFASKSSMGTSPQLVYDSEGVIRLWLRLSTADPDRYNVRACGRLVGGQIQPGPYGKALALATERRT